MAEFGPVLIVFFLIILFPLINMVMLGAAYGTGLFINQKTCAEACVQSTWGQAQNSMKDMSFRMLNSGFGKFAKLTPVNGHQYCGTTLYIVRTNVTSGASEYNTEPIDEANYIWEFLTVSKFKVEPFLNMSGVPFVGTVPGIGVPVDLAFYTHRSVEHTDGLGYDLPGVPGQYTGKGWQTQPPAP